MHYFDRFVGEAVCLRHAIFGYHFDNKSALRPVGLFLNGDIAALDRALTASRLACSAFED